MIIDAYFYASFFDDYLLTHILFLQPMSISGFANNISTYHRGSSIDAGLFSVVVESANSHESFRDCMDIEIYKSILTLSDQSNIIIIVSPIYWRNNLKNTYGISTYLQLSRINMQWQYIYSGVKYYT